jgi:hypothetical protein
MSPQSLVSTSYGVEISGWDLEENFFVEKTELEWNEDQGKKVSLRHRLRDGALVFVRLIASTTWGRSYPIAHEVQNLSLVDSAGCTEVRLVQLQPRFAGHGARS